jgi:DNA repair exonuclease SbcCD ATPase subunit
MQLAPIEQRTAGVRLPPFLKPALPDITKTDPGALHRRVVTQSTVLQQYVRNAEQQKLKIQTVEDKLLEENARLSKALEDQRSYVEELKSTTNDLQKRVAALESLVPRLSKLEAKGNDRSWQEGVEKQFAKLASNLRELAGIAADNERALASFEEKVTFSFSEVFSRWGELVHRIENIRNDA